MTPRKCIDCEGQGVKRKMLNMAGDYTKYHCKTCGGTGFESLFDTCAAITLLNTEVRRLKDAIYWALGENGKFPEEPEPMKIAGMTMPIRKRFWWRSELRKRAGF